MRKAGRGFRLPIRPVGIRVQTVQKEAMPKNLTIPLTEETEARLRNIMEIRGLASMDAAVEYAFAESERQARIQRLYDHALPGEAWADAFYPEYDLDAIRKLDLPAHPPDEAAA